MNIHRTSPRQHCAKRKGYVFIISIVALAVMSAIGVSFLGVASHELATSSRESSALQALAIAEGGVNYVLWRQNYAPVEEHISILTSLGSTIHALIPNEAPRQQCAISSLAENVTLPLASGAPTAAIWINALNVGTAKGYQVIALGEYRGYRRALRVIFQGEKESTGFPGNGTNGNITFKHTLFSNMSAKLNGACTIDGDAVVNGDFDLGGSGNISGSLNVAGNFDLTGNSEVGGRAIVSGDIDMNGAAKIRGGADALGDVTLDGNPLISNGLNLNGDATLGGSTINGTIRTPGDVSIYWGFNGADRIEYGGNFTKPKWMETSIPVVKTNVTPLPPTTGAPISMQPYIDGINFNNLKNQVLNASGIKTYTPPSGTLSIANGLRAITDPALNLNGDLSISGGTTITAPNMKWYVNGDVTITGDTVWNGAAMTLYVHGDVKINGRFTYRSLSQIRIIADGTIEIGGRFDFGNTDVVLLSQTGVDLGQCSSLYAQVYAHNPNPKTPAFARVRSTEITGAVISDFVDIQGSGAVFQYHPSPFDGGGSGSVNDDSGSTTVAWKVASWEVLY